MFDYNVRDSSLYSNPRFYTAALKQDSSLHVGIIRRAFVDLNDQYIYVVEVDNAGAAVEINCVMVSRFYSPMNYEEYNLYPYLDNKLPVQNANTHLDSYSDRTGDIVIVGFLNGNAREGVILGTIKHIKRKTTLKSDELAYITEFNGVETKIKDDGTYKVTWKSKPKNVAFKPVYNELVGGSYYGFDTNGSFYVTDNDLLQKQFITVKKDKHSICIVSGDNRLEIGKTDIAGTNALGIKTTISTIESKDFNLSATNSLKAKSQEMHFKTTKIAIGNSQVELIDTLTKLIVEIGNIIVTSPWGTCSPVNTSPNWPKIVQMKELLSTLVVSIKDPDQLNSFSDSDNFKD